MYIYVCMYLRRYVCIMFVQMYTLLFISTSLSSKILIVATLKSSETWEYLYQTIRFHIPYITTSWPTYFPLGSLIVLHVKTTKSQLALCFPQAFVLTNYKKSPTQLCQTDRRLLRLRSSAVASMRCHHYMFRLHSTTTIKYLITCSCLDTIVRDSVNSIHLFTNYFYVINLI